MLPILLLQAHWVSLKLPAAHDMASSWGTIPPPLAMDLKLGASKEDLNWEVVLSFDKKHFKTVVV